MDKLQVQDILERRAFPGSGGEARLIETHISWVLLSPDFAFKIKKPVRYDFLDFSTLALRKKYCHEEVRLNQRLAPKTYLGVLPIGYQYAALQIAEGIENPVDYAVWMRRENDRRQLDLLLDTTDLLPADLRPLAHQIAVFHRKYALNHYRFNPKGLVADFADLFQYESALAKVLGEATLPLLAKMKQGLPFFIEKHQKRLQERAASGLWVDGHGDLHGRNIFLTEPPIIFDCVEFAPHLRHLDVLNEMAFLCMDFDRHARPHLAAAFLQFYQEEHACIIQPEDELLFLFFKAYRANVRLKVALISGAVKTELLAYWDLMKGYWDLMGCG